MSVAPIGLNATATPAVLANARVNAICVLLSTIGVIGFGSFNQKLFGAGISNLQQYAIVGLWSACALLCLGANKIQSIDKIAVSIFTSIILLSFSSSLWSPEPIDSASKALVLVVTSLSAIFVVQAIGLENAVKSLRRGLAIAVLTSILIVFLRPDVGLMETYLHVGKWRGIFGQKQLLGASSSLLFVLYLYAKNGRMPLIRLAMLALCLLAIIYTESAVALITVATVAMVKFTYSWKFVRSASAAAPVFLAIFAGVAVLWLGLTGEKSFWILGEEVTAQNRTLIWEFALRAWADVALFGYGINGFWTNEVSLAQFQMENGWALDNFHSGYVATLAETGLFGYLLLIAFLAVKRSHIRRAMKSMGWKGVDPILVGFPVYFFVLNLTETFLFRSTSTYFSLAIMVLVVSPFTTPTAQSEVSEKLISAQDNRIKKRESYLIHSRKNPA